MSATSDLTGYDRDRLTAEEVRNEFLRRDDNYRFDLRDFTDPSMVYGMKYTPVVRLSRSDDGYNLGNLTNTTGDYYLHYRFFRFREIYDNYISIWDKCGCFSNINIREVPRERVMSSILRVFGENNKYYQTISGRERGYRICIFQYAGKVEEGKGNLYELARQFEERDRREAMILSEYYNSRLKDSFKETM